MSASWLTAIGLALDFLGFLLLFLGWAGPSPIIGYGGNVGIDVDPDDPRNNRKSEEYNPDNGKMLPWKNRKTRRYWRQPNRIKRDFSLLLILFGLLLQLIATFELNPKR